jgi:hypothetical protein
MKYLAAIGELMIAAYRRFFPLRKMHPGVTSAEAARIIAARQNEFREIYESKSAIQLPRKTQ